MILKRHCIIASVFALAICLAFMPWWLPMWVCIPLALMIAAGILAACTIFSDDFSVDNLATDWDDRSGTWAVGSGVLSTVSASALIVTVDDVTTGLTGVYATAKITCATTSDIGRIIIAYDDDSNYWFLEVQPGTNHGWLRLYQRAAASNTLIAASKVSGYQANEQVTATLCYASGYIRAFIGSPEIGIEYAATITVANTQCGLGTGAGSSDVEFDDFSFSKVTADQSNCSDCTDDSPTAGGAAYCVAYSDDFSTDDLSDNYTAVSGSFSVSGGEAVATSSAFIVSNARVSSGHGRTVVKAKADTTGDIVKVVGSYTSTANCLIGELTFNGASSTFKLFNGAAQLCNTYTFTASLNTYYTLIVCWDGTTAYGFVALSSTKDCKALVSCAYTGSAKQGGFATTLGGTSTFDDFSLTKASGENDACPECNDTDDIDGDCECQGCSPVFMGAFDVELSGIGPGAVTPCADCATLDGLYRVNRNDIGPSPTGCGGASDCCSWDLYHSAACTSHYIALQIFKVGANWIISIKLGWTANPGSGGIVWQETIGASKADCGAYDGEDIAYAVEDGAFPDCVGTASTCTVTAVPI